MIVYGGTLSPFVRKVMAFAREKGLTPELRPGGFGRGGDEFAETSPFAKMPGFRDPGADGGRDFTISDSTAIVTYLEAKFPEPAMMPADPIGRARAMWYEEFGDTIVARTVVAIFFNRFVAPRLLGRDGDAAAADAAERDELPRVLDYLEAVVPGDDGFLLGDRIGLADIAVASPFVNLAHVGVALDAARWPRAATYLDRMLARPSFEGLIAEERRFMAKFG